MPTLRGRTLILLGVAMYVVAVITNIQEFFGIATAAVIFPLVSMGFVRYGRHRIAFSRAFAPRRAFAGATIRVDVTAHNLARAKSPPLYLEDAAPSALGGTMRFSVPSLGADERESASIERRVVKRGRYTLGPMHARLVDPFGLAEIHHQAAPEAKLIVYPAIESLQEGSPPEERQGGGRSLVQRLATSGDDFYAVRGWQDGDDMRMVHWRSTARHGEIMIRQDEIRPFPRATVFADTRGALHRGSGAHDSLEWAISAAASISWELARQGFALRMATPDAGPGGARWGREATDPILTSLALARPSPARSVTPVVRRLAARPGAGGIVFAVMPPPESGALTHLSRLRRAYAWGGAILLDVASFVEVTARERAAFDQQLAEAERYLARAGWTVTIAGGADRIGTVWKNLLALGAPRKSSSSLRS
jgi:uncharacterized protein (DUF58 family)